MKPIYKPKGAAGEYGEYALIALIHVFTVMYLLFCIKIEVNSIRSLSRGKTL